MQIKTIAVQVTLICRGCNGKFERTLQRQEGEVGDPPTEFECATCTKSRSMIDGQDVRALINDPRPSVRRLARIVVRKRFADECLVGGEEGCYIEYVDGTYSNFHPYPAYRAEEKCKAAARSRERHPERDRARKWQRTSGGLFSRDEWYARVAEFGWKCSICGQPVKETTVRCGHALADAGDGLDNRVPLCRRCQCAQAARRPRKREEKQ